MHQACTQKLRSSFSRLCGVCAYTDAFQRVSGANDGSATPSPPLGVGWNALRVDDDMAGWPAAATGRRCTRNHRYCPECAAATLGAMLLVDKFTRAVRKAYGGENVAAAVTATLLLKHNSPEWNLCLPGLFA